MSSPPRSRAQEEGSALLRSFRNRQDESREASYASSYTTAKSPDEKKPNLDALAVGARVAVAYSDHKKSGVLSSSQAAASVNSSIAAEQTALILLEAALDGIRDAGSKVSSQGVSPASDFKELSEALSELRVHLESTSVRRKLHQSRAGGDGDGDVQGSTVDRSVLNNYMKNQLDLNETEMEYYEKTVDELVSQLDVAKTEAEEKQAMLSERDGALAQAQTERAALEGRVDAIMSELKEAQLQSSTHDEALQRARADLASARAEVADWRVKVSKADASYDELNDSTNKATSALESALEATKAEVQELQRSLEMEITAKDRAQSEFDTLYQEAETRAETAEVVSQQLRSQLEDVQRRLDAADADILAARNAEHAALKEAAEARNDAAAAAAHLERTDGDEGNLKGSERAVIDNYMNNQLDLQAAELDQHEEEVNLLVEELEASKMELEKATDRAERALQERNLLREEAKNARSVIDELRRAAAAAAVGADGMTETMSQQKDAAVAELAAVREEKAILQQSVDQLTTALSIAEDSVAERETELSELLGRVEDAEFALRESEQRADRLTDELEKSRRNEDAQRTVALEAGATVAQLRTELVGAAEAAKAATTPAVSTEHALNMLSEAQAEVEKLRVDVSSGRAKLEARDSSLRALHSEVEVLRRELDAMQQQQQQQQQQSSPGTGSGAAQSMQLSELEAVNVDLSARLSHEVQVNEWLRGLMAKVGEKDEVSESLLSELRADREALAKQLQSTIAALEEAKLDRGRIAGELEGERARAAVRIADLERRRDVLETRSEHASGASNSEVRPTRTLTLTLTDPQPNPNLNPIQIDELREERRIVEEALALERERSASLAASARESESASRRAQSLMGQLGREVSHYHQVRSCLKPKPKSRTKFIPSSNSNPNPNPEPCSLSRSWSTRKEPCCRRWNSGCCTTTSVWLRRSHAFVTCLPPG